MNRKYQDKVNSALCIAECNEAGANWAAGFEAMRKTASEIAHEADIEIADLAMLLRRIIAKPTPKNIEGAWGYLGRKGLQGSVLRDNNADATPIASATPN